MPMMTISVDPIDALMDLVPRLLALRKRKLIGPIFVEAGHVYIAESEYDPWGSRMFMRLDEIRSMVERLEAEQGLVVPHRGPALAPGGENRSRAA